MQVMRSHQDCSRVVGILNRDHGACLELQLASCCWCASLNQKMSMSSNRPDIDTKWSIGKALQCVLGAVAYHKGHISNSRAIVWYAEHSYTLYSFQIVTNKKDNNIEIFTFGFVKHYMQIQQQNSKGMPSASSFHFSALVFVKLLLYLTYRQSF